LGIRISARLVAKSKRPTSIGQWDNTVVFFQSDNGAESGAAWPLGGGANTDNSLENIGRPLSNVDYGKRWAEVSATPFKLFKAFPTEGGVTVPAIVRMPRQHHGGPHFRGVTHTMDLAPTFLELAGIRDPGSMYKGRPVHPLEGVSLVPVFKQRASSARPKGSVLAYELLGRRYVRKDNWKAVWVEAPWATGHWTLYDLRNDPAEMNDLSAARPEIMAELVAEWDNYVARVGVVEPDMIGMPFREGLP